MLDSSTKLTNNSLIQRVERTGAEARLSMLETIGEYGREHLEAKGELSAVRQLHAAYFLALAEAGKGRPGGLAKRTGVIGLTTSTPTSALP